MIDPDCGILVVDVDPLRARGLAAGLRREGEAVAIASSVAEALDRPRPDALVVTSQLPDGGAYELLAGLEARGPLPWTLLLVPRIGAQDCLRALRAGAREVLALSTPLEEVARLVISRPREVPAPLPATPRASIEVRCESGPRSSERAIRAIVAFALRGGLRPGVRARIGSAVGEILENACEHGYPDHLGKILLRATLEPKELTVEIRDRGEGFDSATALQLASECATLSGLVRARALSEGLEIESQPGSGTRVVLRFAAYRVDFDEEDDAIDLTDIDWLPPRHAHRILHELGREGDDGTFHLSPALAIVLGRLLAEPGHPEHIVAAP